MRGYRTPLAAAILAVGAPALQAQTAQTAQTAQSPAAAAAAFRVIVNASSPVSTMPKADVSRLFMKRVVAWKHGGKVVPLDLGEASAARKAFSRAVLGKDVAAVKGYWQQLIFTGRGVPPVEKSSEAEVVAYVAANPAAIGYVSAATALGARVKVLQITQ
jgi:ABC-type phosphate transport system substrate-binding protein